MADKPPYKLKIKIDSARADALADAFKAIQEIVGDNEAMTGDHATVITLEAHTEAPLVAVREAFERFATVITLEAHTEAPLVAVREAFERFLWHHPVGMECKIGLESPGVRPEMAATLRSTPMEREWQKFADDYGTEVRGSVLGQKVDVKPRTA